MKVFYTNHFFERFFARTGYRECDCDKEVARQIVYANELTADCIIPWSNRNVYGIRTELGIIIAIHRGEDIYAATTFLTWDCFQQHRKTALRTTSFRIPEQKAPVLLKTAA